MNRPTPKPSQFLFTFDAYDNPPPPNNHTIIARLAQRVETQPGLHELAARRGGAEEALAPLLDWARAVVPRRERARTPLLLMATGGARRLPEGRRRDLLDRARAVVARAGFLSRPEWARVISGAEEAAYGWVAVNFLAGRLGAGRGGDGNGGDGADGAPPATLGVLDLGGASLEVAFELPPPGSGSGDDDADHWRHRAVNVTLAGRTHALHTHAFGALGLNEAFDRGVGLLLADMRRASTAAAAATPGSGSGSSAAAGGAAAEAAATKAAPPSSDPMSPAPTSLSSPGSTGAAQHAPGPASAGAAAEGDQGEEQRQHSPGANGGQPSTPKGKEKQRQALPPGAANAPATNASAAVGRPPDDAARRRLSGRGVTGRPPVVVRHPCLHEGFSAPYNATAAAPAAVTLVGAPDFAACAALAARLVNASAPCADGGGAPGACVLGARQPRTLGGAQRFAAVSGFFVVAAFLRLPPGSAPAALLPAAERHCRTPWPRVVASGLGAAANAERYCGWAPYAHALLTAGLGLADDGSRVSFGSDGVSWSLGAALVEAGALPGFMPANSSGSSTSGSTSGGGISLLSLPWAAAILAAAVVALALLLLLRGARLPLSALPLAAGGTAKSPPQVRRGSRHTPGRLRTGAGGGPFALPDWVAGPAALNVGVAGGARCQQ